MHPPLEIRGFLAWLCNVVPLIRFLTSAKAPETVL